MYESDLLPALKRSGANFDAYPQYSRIAERFASLKVFCTGSTKRILTQCLLHKYEVDDQKYTLITLRKYKSSCNFQSVRFLKPKIWALVPQNVKTVNLCKNLRD